jgi:hypothetical protein
MAEERIGAVPGAGEREVGGGGCRLRAGWWGEGHHRAQERAGSDQDGEQGEQAAGLGLAWTRVGEGVPGLVQPPKLETFHEAEFFGIPEPERGAFLESGVPAVEMFGDGSGGDRGGPPAQGKPGDGGGAAAEDCGGEGMKREHQPGGHAGGGAENAEGAEGAVSSPLPGEGFERRAVHSGDAGGDG